MSIFKKKMSPKCLTLSSPISGKIVSLTSVPDETFSEKILGEGIAVIPSEGKLVASDAGTVLSVADTKHAIVVSYDSGVEILMHIGIDTVGLNGKGYTAHVSAGDNIEKGNILIEFDIQLIKENGYDVITPLIITNSDEFSKFTASNGEINIGERLLEIEK